MVILAVDDERSALRVLEREIRKAVPNCQLSCFTSAKAAIEYAKKIKVDVAFLDIEMIEKSGITLAKDLTRLNKMINILFVTAYKSYALHAFNVRASGYILKPPDSEKILQELKNLRNPVTDENRLRVRIQCFGLFEVFINEEPVSFGRTRSKEVFAILVDKKGASVTKKEIAAILWEDVPYSRNQQKNLGNILSEMIRVFKQYNINDIILRNNGSYSLNIKLVECDYYDYLKGNRSALMQYDGRYMENYSWAELTNALLTASKNHYTDFSV